MLPYPTALLQISNWPYGTFEGLITSTVRAHFFQLSYHDHKELEQFRALRRESIKSTNGGGGRKRKNPQPEKTIPLG